MLPNLLRLKGRRLGADCGGNILIEFALALPIIFLLLAANFQSLRLSVVVISTVPAVIAGVALTLAIARGKVQPASSASTKAACNKLAGT